MPLPLEEAANLLERRSSDIQDLVKCTAPRNTLKVSRRTLFLCPTSKATGVPGYLPPGAKPVAASPTCSKDPYADLSLRSDGHRECVCAGPCRERRSGSQGRTLF